MNMFIIKGRLRDRLLLNYRVDPDLLRPLLPPPFEPLRVAGWGVAGLCLIRLDGLRPRGVPRALGVGSSNAAHRIAVTWPGGRGVYILRRDSASLLSVMAGGRLFPGVHRRARLEIAEQQGRWAAAMETPGAGFRVEARIAETPTAGSLFEDVEAASAFFRGGSLGYSPSLKPGGLEGLELRTEGWNLEPLQVERLESSFFDGFPAGSIAFDSAFVMRDLELEWRAIGPAGGRRAGA